MPVLPGLKSMSRLAAVRSMRLSRQLLIAERMSASRPAAGLLPTSSSTPRLSIRIDYT